MYACFVFLVCVTVWTGLAGYAESITREVDETVGYIFAGLAGISQIGFLFFVMHLRKSEKLKIKMGVREIERHMRNNAFCKDIRMENVMFLLWCGLFIVLIWVLRFYFIKHLEITISIDEFTLSFARKLCTFKVCKKSLHEKSLSTGLV